MSNDKLRFVASVSNTEILEDTEWSEKEAQRKVDLWAIDKTAGEKARAYAGVLVDDSGKIVRYVYLLATVKDNRLVVSKSAVLRIAFDLVSGKVQYPEHRIALKKVIGDYIERMGGIPPWGTSAYLRECQSRVVYEMSGPSEEYKIGRKQKRLMCKDGRGNLLAGPLMPK